MPCLWKRVLAFAGLAAASLSGFDGSMQGPYIGLGLGFQDTEFSGEGGIRASGHAYPSRADGIGMAWEAEAGYAWGAFALTTRFSRRNFASTLWRDSLGGAPFREGADVTVHYPSLGMGLFLAHSIIGPPRTAYLIADFGGQFINEDEIFKTLGAGYSAGVGHELFKHAFLELKWISGGESGAERTIEISSLQILLKGILY